MQSQPGEKQKKKSDWWVYDFTLFSEWPFLKKKNTYTGYGENQILQIIELSSSDRE